MNVKFLRTFVWVKRGRQRLAIIKVLEQAKFPSEIQRDAKKYNPKISLNNCSDVLRSFVDKKIAVCLNPTEKIGRMYELTPLGKKVLENVK